VNGAWDKAHRRVLFADQGDIVLVDSIANTRRQMTRMTGTESNPRGRGANRRHLHARQQPLSRALDTGAPGGLGGLGPWGIIQLTDVQSKKRDSRDTDSQKFVKAEEQKLIEHTRIEAEKKKKAEEKEKARALRSSSWRAPVAADLQLSPDGKHVF